MGRTRKLVGIRRKRKGWQAFVWIDGHFYSKAFVLETPLAMMQAWRRAQRVSHADPQAPRRRELIAEIRQYLDQLSLDSLTTLHDVADRLIRTEQPTHAQP